MNTQANQTQDTQDNGTQDNGTQAPLPGSIGAALAQSSGAQDGATVAEISERDKTAAAEILTAIEGKISAAAVLKTAGEGLYGTVMRHIAVNGATFAGIEAAAPKLTQSAKSGGYSGTYNPIKSMILTAQKNGTPLLDAEGKPVSKTELAKLNKAAKPATVQPETEKDASGRALTAEEICLLAIGNFRASAMLRDKFGAELLGLAEAYKRDVEIAEAARITAEAAGANGEAAARAGIQAAQERQDMEAAEAHRQAEAVKANAAALNADYAAAGLSKQDGEKPAETAPDVAPETAPVSVMVAAMETAKTRKSKGKTAKA